MEFTSSPNRLAKLLRLHSSAHPTKQTTLEAYVGRMKEKQQAIYYMAGKSREEVENSPFVERLLKKGFEVLYLTEPVDEYCIQFMGEFEGIPFRDVVKEGVKLEQQGDKSEEEEHRRLEKTTTTRHVPCPVTPSQQNRLSKSGPTKMAKCTFKPTAAGTSSSSAPMHNCHRQFPSRSLEDVSSPPKSSAKSSAEWAVGDRIRCFHKKLEYEAKIEEKLTHRGQIYYLVHYVGWSKRWDELIPEKEAHDRFRAWDASELPPGMFNVSHLCGKRIHKKNRLEYLVRWEGYDDKDDTWEPANKLIADGCEWAIEEYEKKFAADYRRMMREDSQPVKKGTPQRGFSRPQ